MVNLYFVGTAGSGKTTLTYAFQLWMNQAGYDCITVNLDPGAERLPYPADVDVRDWVSLPQIMDEYSLGPNGAQIICADMLVLKANEIKEAIEEFKAEYYLIDTPGQIELFAYRDASKVLIESFGEKESLLAFLIDPLLARSPQGFISLTMLSYSVQFRLNLPTINVLSKADLLEEDEIEKILIWSRDSGELYQALMEAPGTMQTQVSFELFKALDSIEGYRTLTPVSSESFFGMEDLYNAVQQVFYGGEDLEK
jgi:hypothetical protein